MRARHGRCVPSIHEGTRPQPHDDGVVSVRREASLAEVARILANNSFGALPVVGADDVPVGIVSDTDLMRLLLTGAATSAMVAEFMSTPVEVVDELVTVDEVMHQMRTRRIHHLPVVQHRKLVGMVTPADVVRWFVANRLDSLPPLA